MHVLHAAGRVRLGIPALLRARSVPLQRAVIYYPHRMFHIPFLYRHVHKVHHRYGSPTLYTATAMHTLEFLVYQTLLMLPVFVVPLHAGEFFPVFLNASELSSVSLHVCKFLYVPLSVWKTVFLYRCT
ncbi:hypothetical protein DPMN_101578 [Dreissena polymorpha]|uniref:Fatty acid hydroxylase domain-containing protein n=1 Tax=Dreissena polymorpha TaxID=45954 RepID=A0A9D4LJP8_DREPO|nr:hypothetical protein DPMN_101578 [Dreissena polymorpha]